MVDVGHQLGFEDGDADIPGFIFARRVNQEFFYPFQEITAKTLFTRHHLLDLFFETFIAVSGQVPRMIQDLWLRMVNDAAVPMQQKCVTLSANSQRRQIIAESGFLDIKGEDTDRLGAVFKIKNQFADINSVIICINIGNIRFFAKR